MPTDKEQLIQTVSELYNCYEDDDYMRPKIMNYITNQLPNIFLHMKENHESNLARQMELKLEHNIFIESFLNNNQFCNQNLVGIVCCNNLKQFGHKELCNNHRFCNNQCWPCNNHHFCNNQSACTRGRFC